MCRPRVEQGQTLAPVTVGEDTAAAVARAEEVAALVSVHTSPSAEGEPPTRRLPSAECWT